MIDLCSRGETEDTARLGRAAERRGGSNPSGSTPWVSNHTMGPSLRGAARSREELQVRSYR